MLLKDFEQIAEIDSTILDLHSKLEGLYKQRTHIFDGTMFTKLSDQQARIIRKCACNDLGALTERQRYDALAESWKAVGVTIPTFSTLKDKMCRAVTLLNACNEAQPECAFRIALIPPRSIYKTANGGAPLKFSPVFVAQRRRPRDWKLYVVATNPEGVEIKDPQQFIKEDGMMVGDVFMTGLNTYEYTVLLGMTEHPIDIESWSILVRDVDTRLGLVPCVMYQSGIYNFEVDSADVLIGKNHFRPAMEVE